ncbi:MAG TPA: hypothetical protein VFH92_10920 [Phenylobacterium sp.]|nr:hypothetical protein [Phenylobacterium sp.]
MDARRYATGGAPAPPKLTPASQARVWASVAARIDALADPNAAPRPARPAVARRVFPPDFPEGLKPRLRLFLSVDLVGSTSYKQSRQQWSPEILSFYRNFDYALQAQYRAFSEGHRTALPAPEFWKSNGDELLYVCELQNLSHAHAVIHLWLAALNDYRAMGDATKPMDVKSTAWIGLFPAPNAEIFFRRGAPPPASDAGDPVLAQADLREEWYANPNNPAITRDFVGPSMDTGFRLTSWATPRRMIVSVDLAFVLTGAYTRGVGPLRLHFSGKDKLKGVIGNQPYPTIWIPVGDERPSPEGLRADGISTDRATIRAHCESIIEQNYRSITPLFLAGARHEDFDWVPPYILTRILKNWQDEVQYRTDVTGVVLLD